MRAEGASELKSTVLSPSFSQRATVASSEFRPERLAGRTQSARAAPSARTERVARPQAVSLSVLIIAVSASREGTAVSTKPSMTQVAKGCAAGFLRYPAMAWRQLQSPIERAVKECEPKSNFEPKSKEYRTLYIGRPSRSSRLCYAWLEIGV